MHDFGIWVPVEGGWMIHEFEQYGEPTIHEPNSKSDAGRAGGIASVEARRAKNGIAQPKQAFSDGLLRSNGPEAEPEARRSASVAASVEAARSTPGSTYQISAKDQDLSDQDPDPPLSPPSNGSEAKLGSSEPIELKASDADRSFVRTVFDAWQEDTGHHRTILDRKRARRILARKREGFTTERLILAITNRRNDPFLMGENDTGRVYDDIETLLRDAAQVERLERLVDRMRSNGRPGHRTVQPNHGMTGFEKATIVR
jgi:hypothetical protein